ncbi:MAG: DUF1028 domain-containing protein [Candidatus Bathyarchaeota archaeon]|nr:DUF1028 domain-containing protein [Candidatus Bathyarchaeota archaeon]
MLTRKSKPHAPLGTFTILAISPDSNLMGVATASGSTNVGDRVPHAKPGVGVIATQAYTNIAYGVKGLKLLEQGLSPEHALVKLLMEDSERNMRQVAIMDFKRRKAVFTGSNVPEFWAEVVGEDYIVVGNLLSTKNVVNSIAKEFEVSKGSLVLRMAKALQVGSKSGGDKRGERSAALMVISNEKVEIEIKVGMHAQPIEELLRLLKSQSVQC